MTTLTLSTLVPSLIRTYVPVIVGALLSWFVTMGTELDKDTEHGLTVFLTGLLIAIYYTVVRFLEKRWPALSVLLGSTQMPAAYSNVGEDGAVIITDAPESTSDGSHGAGAGNYPPRLF